jgi:hypothetical protein
MQTRAIPTLIFCEKCVTIPRNPRIVIATRTEHQKGAVGMRKTIVFYCI